MKDSRRKFFKTGVALIGGTVLGARYLSAMPIHFGKEVVNVGVKSSAYNTRFKTKV